MKTKALLSLLVAITAVTSAPRRGLLVMAVAADLLVGVVATPVEAASVQVAVQ
jgi:hypothetical protein